MPESHSLRFGDIARRVQDLNGEIDRLQTGVDLAVQLIEACDHAGVTITVGQVVTTAAATDELVRQGDAWQYELNEGPCWDAVRSEPMVISQDLASEGRWPTWGPRILGAGIHSVLSLQLYAQHDSLGALNLYAHRRWQWTSTAITAAHGLAGQLAGALADARELDYRGRAMSARSVIGQAQGILMERYGISTERAFEYLRRISQDSNRKLVTVAEELVAARQRPDADDNRLGHRRLSSS